METCERTTIKTSQNADLVGRLVSLLRLSGLLSSAFPIAEYTRRETDTHRRRSPYEHSCIPPALDRAAVNTIKNESAAIKDGCD